MGVRTKQPCRCKRCLDAKKKLSTQPDISEKSKTEDKHAFSSGATSSEHKPAYHLIFQETIERLAKRMGLGAEKHGDVNYQKCIKKSTDGRVLILDVAFARDRYNHGIIHLTNLKSNPWTSGPNTKDDDIGAFLWFGNFAIYVEKHGFNWYRILNPHFVNEVEMAVLKGTNQILWVKTKDGRVHKYVSFTE